MRASATFIGTVLHRFALAADSTTGVSVSTFSELAEAVHAQVSPLTLVSREYVFRYPLKLHNATTLSVEGSVGGATALSAGFRLAGLFIVDGGYFFSA